MIKQCRNFQAKRQFKHLQIVCAFAVASRRAHSILQVIFQMQNMESVVAAEKNAQQSIDKMRCCLKHSESYNSSELSEVVRLTAVAQSFFSLTESKAVG